MSRRNLYEIISQREITPIKAFSRIRYRYTDSFYDDPYDMQGITLYSFTEKYVFEKLPIRGTCIDLSDLLQDLGIYLDTGTCSIDDVLLLIEFILCVIDSTPKELKNIPQSDGTMIYDEITDVIDTTLNMLSMTIIAGKQGRIVVPKNYKANQAATIVSSEDASWDLLQYNHFTNNGNLKSKQAILKRLGDYLEPTLQKRDEFKNEHWSETAKTVSDLLNNFNIRHNNKTGNKRQAYIAEMSDTELEVWYDKTYNAIILMILEQEIKDITKEIRALRKSSGSHNLV